MICTASSTKMSRSYACIGFEIADNCVSIERMIHDYNRVSYFSCLFVSLFEGELTLVSFTVHAANSFLKLESRSNCE